MSSGDFKIARIKSRHKAELSLLSDATKLAQERVPILKATAETRREVQSMTDALSTLAKYTKTGGFDPTRTFQHVANFDTPIWTLILDMFARYDDEGNQMDDGLLYKTDPVDGVLKINKDFFYALVDYFREQGIDCDMRGRIILN
jgi:hypothetical protein